MYIGCMVQSVGLGADVYHYVDAKSKWVVVFWAFQLYSCCMHGLVINKLKLDGEYTLILILV